MFEVVVVVLVVKVEQVGVVVGVQSIQIKVPPVQFVFISQV